MPLFRLTLSTIFRRKAWAVCAFVVLVMPFLLPKLSSGTENPALLKPALAQAAWGMAWLSAVFWGFFAASRIGDRLSRSGLGEYFHSSGLSATRQLLETWAAVMIYIAPLGLAALNGFLSRFRGAHRLGLPRLDHADRLSFAHVNHVTAIFRACCGCPRCQ